MSFERTVSLRIDDAEVCFLTVSFSERDKEPDEFNLEIRSSRHNPMIGQATWHLLHTGDSFEFQLSMQTVGSAICLAGCLAGMLKDGGPIVSCLKKAKSRSEARRCIDSNGLLGAVGSMSCIYGCLSLA